MSIKKIFELGEDFFKNQYELKFLTIPKVLEDEMPRSSILKESLFRVTSLTIQSSQVPVTEYKHRGISVSIPFGIEETVQEMIFNIRFDRELEFYKVLEYWKNKICKKGSSVFSPNLDLFNSSLELTRNLNITEKSNPPGKMIFYGAYPKKIEISEYSYEDQAPVTAPVTIGFIYYEDSLIDKVQ